MAPGSASVLSRLRSGLAHLLWLVCALCALVLAVGALLVALDANQDNMLVDLVLRAADAVDLGVFSRVDGIAQIQGQGADVKNTLANWGLAAIVWLVVGRILDRVINP